MRAAPEPSVDFVNELASWAWLERTAAGPVAFLLLAHPEAGSESVQPQLAALTLSLRLLRPTRRLADVGRRIAVIGGRLAAVRLDGCDHMVQVEVGRVWAEFVGAGGPAALMVGLAPLRRRASREEVERYIAINTMRGRLRLGLAESVGTFSEPEAPYLRY